MQSIISKNTILLLIIILIGGFFRFYKLDWGQELFTHPDEYHIVASVSQLSFPNQMNPHFFSYGTVTIYLIYFTKLIISSISSQLYPIPYTLYPFLIGRFYSALFSTLTIFLIYKISRKIMPESYALLSAFLAATTAGLIQQAHFLTPESNLIFFLLGSLFFLLKFSQTSPISLKPLILSSIFLGLGIGVKISGIIFFLPLFLALAIKLFSQPAKLILFTIISLATIIATLFIIDPYIFLDFPAFKSNIEYEGLLAAGQIPVFYTRQFINTTPVLFQLEKIYPWTLGPALLVLGILGMLGIFYFILKSSHNTYYIILATAFLSLFIPNAFLFAKWTRFSSPTFPFFAIFAAFFLFILKSYFLNLKSFLFILITLYLILSLTWTLSFFSIYLRDDVRITASSWLETNIPPQSQILVEGGNMVDLPIQGNFTRMSVDFYTMDTDPLSQRQIFSALKEADYFIVQSRRVFLNHQRLPDQFPQTAKFYQDLFDGSLGFTQIKEFHSYPGLSLFGKNIEFPDEQAEETWSVFDHPVIRVFQKI